MVYDGDDPIVIPPSAQPEEEEVIVNDGLNGNGNGNGNGGNGNGGNDNGNETETIEEQIARLEKEAADAQAAADAAAKAAEEAAKAEAAQAARAADKAAAAAGLPDPSNIPAGVDLTNLQDFEKFRFGDNTFQSDFQTVKAVNPDTGNIENKVIEMWDTEAFGLRPASWYKSQGLSKPKVDVRKDRSVSTTIGPSGEQYTWDSKGNIMSGGTGWQVNQEDLQHVLRSMRRTGVKQYRIPTDILSIQSESVKADLKWKETLAADKAAEEAAKKAQEALDKANQALADAQTQKEARDAQLAKEKAAEALAQANENIYAGGGGIGLGTAQGVVDTQPAGEPQQTVSEDIGLPDDTQEAEGATWYMSSGTGLEPLADAADPIVVDEGVTWLVGNSYAGIASTTPTQPKAEDTSAPAGTYLSGDIGLGIPDSNIQPVAENRTATQRQADLDALDITGGAGNFIGGITDTVFNLFGSNNNNQNVTQKGGTKTTTPDLNFGVNTSGKKLTKEAKDLFSGF